MRKKMIAALCTSAALFGMTVNAQADAKNVILMISDGAGFNTLRATNYYTGAAAIYESFNVRLGMQTASANNQVGYDPSAMAADFNYAKSGATDSASAATAMFTGVKNYDGTINMTTDGKPLTTFFEKAAQAGKSIGAVSSVQLSHATPAAVYGHNTNRNNYAEMGLEAVDGSNPNSHNDGYDPANYSDNLKVVMGTGNPNYTADGIYKAPNSESSYRYVGGSQAWTDLTNGTNNWTLVQEKADFDALTSGPTPDKVFGVPQNGSTLQQGRSKGSAILTNVPTLETMTKAALNVLDNGPNGFAVMIEGGAVDWANHANQLDRMIEEQIDFNNAVQAAYDWVMSFSSWDETLLIVTADHETGYLMGDGIGGFVDLNSNGVYDASVDYSQIADKGVGVLPGAVYFSGSHTNALVPLFAMGAGSEMFANYIIGSDPYMMERYGLDQPWNGDYVDNTSIFAVMDYASSTPVPEPATMLIFGTGLAGLAGFSRRRK